MPSVKRGLYGEKLTVDNASLEHLKPHSEGGKTDIANLALASKELNNARGTTPLKEILDWEAAEEYLSQFNFRISGFNGFLYADLVRKTLAELGIEAPKKAKKKKKGNHLDLVG